jgi:hypothetical protein
MVKLCIVTALGLLLFMETMVGGPLGVSRAQPGASRVTLASLAGRFTSTGTGIETVCFKAGFKALEDCASAPRPQQVSFKLTGIARATRDTAGNACSVGTWTARAVVVGPTSSPFGPGIIPITNVSTTITFDPMTGSGTASFSQYRGGSCIGAIFDSRDAILTGTGTVSFMVSDSGNRIDQILTRFSVVNSAYSLPGSVNYPWFNVTSIRQPD